MGIFKRKKEERQARKDNEEKPKFTDAVKISTYKPNYFMSWLRDKIDESALGEFLEDVDKVMGFENEYGRYIYYKDKNTIITLPWTEERENDPFSLLAKNSILARTTFCKKSNLEDHLIAITKASDIIHTKTWVEFFTEIDKSYARNNKQDFDINKLPSDNISFLSRLRYEASERKSSIQYNISNMIKLKRNLELEEEKTANNPEYKPNTKYIDDLIERLQLHQNILDNQYKLLKTTQKEIEKRKPLQAKMNLIKKKSKERAAKTIEHAEAATARSEVFHEKQYELDRESNQIRFEIRESKQRLKQIRAEKARQKNEYWENEIKQNKIDRQIENEK